MAKPDVVIAVVTSIVSVIALSVNVVAAGTQSMVVDHSEANITVQS